MRRIGAALMIGVITLTVASCSEDGPTDYSAENEEAFMAACVDTEADGIFQQRICRCVYETTVAEIPYERFVEIEDQLSEIDSDQLPQDFLGVIAGCVIEEGDL